MVGIRACGTYVPIWRLDLTCANPAWRGERAIANFDEDSLTMGVAAAINCLRTIDRSTIDGLFFASTTFPYLEKQTSVIAATALDLRTDIMTADFANSLRSGTIALQAAFDKVGNGSAKQILVIASDMRVPQPGSDFEREFGDGAAAFLVSSEGAHVSCEASYLLADEMFDVWRSNEDRYARSWEERFNTEEGYFRIVPRAVSGLLEKARVAPKEFAKIALNGPNSRRQQEMAKKLGFAPSQVQGAIFGAVGDTGAAASLMLLAASLEDAATGDKIMLANYGNGAEAFLLQVHSRINVAPSLGTQIKAKLVLRDYQRYLGWRGLLEKVSGRRRPPLPTPSVSCIWREAEQNIRLHGVKCTKCGMVQFPRQRVCYKCHAKDEFESYRLSDKPGKLATFAEDATTAVADPPLVLSVVDFEGGGRMWAYMTDKDSSQIRIDMPVLMTFRKLFTNEGIHNYYWKSTPFRYAEGKTK